jgi:hypothetical protein
MIRGAAIVRSAGDRIGTHLRWFNDGGLGVVAADCTEQVERYRFRGDVELELEREVDSEVL